MSDYMPKLVQFGSSIEQLV